MKTEGVYLIPIFILNWIQVLFRQPFCLHMSNFKNKIIVFVLKAWRRLMKLRDVYFMSHWSF